MWHRILLVLMLNSVIFVHGQAVLDSLPVIQRGQILFLGENHYIEEILDLEVEIIKHVAHTSKDTLTVFLELPCVENYYVNQLFQNNDSISFYNYLKILPDKVLTKYISKVFFSLYDVYSQNRNLKLICVDANPSEDRFVYTLDMLFSKYTQLPFCIRQMRDEISLYLQHKDSQSAKNNLSVAKFRKHFKKFKKEYKSLLTEEDFNYLVLNIDNFYTNMDDRESLLYRNICRQYSSNHRYVVIIGVTHANKKEIQFTRKKYSSNTKPVAWSLNNKRSSPFNNQVFSLYIAPLTLWIPQLSDSNNDDVVWQGYPFFSPQMPDEIKQELIGRNHPITIKILDKTSNQESFDGFVLIRDVHTMID